MKYLRVILIVLLLVCCSLWVASYWWITHALMSWHDEYFTAHRGKWLGIVVNTIFYAAILWLILLLALPLVISATPWARRRRRAKQGLCIRCAYDLSGTDHTLCPECGTEVRKTNPA